MSQYTVCGVDEAGRGPVIGPLVLGCVVVDDGGREKLAELKVKDSKKLSPARRLELAPLIKEVALDWGVIHVLPAEIDRMRKTMSLNVIEAYRTAELVMSLSTRPAKVIVDAADSVEERYSERIVAALKMLSPDDAVPEVLAEHRADDNYLEVSAASVLAKVERDRAVEALRAEHGDFGSGYPSDALTQDYIRRILRAGEMPEFVRRSWSTLDKGRQRCLPEF
jgi:ribonuclease HII